MVGVQAINPKDIALFVSQHSRNRTAAIDANNRILGYLPAPAGFLALGPQGNLYDVPFNNTDVLVIYHPPYMKPSATIGFGDYTTVGVAVDHHTGSYAVTSINYNNGGGGSQVSVFTRDDKLCLTIPQPPEGFFIGGSAYDREGRLLVLLNTGASSRFLVGEISGGCEAKRIELHMLPLNIYPGEFIAINKQDNIVLQSSYNVVTFAHPNGPFGPPLATTVLPNLTFLSCLTADGQYFWAAAFQGHNHANVLLKYEYPSGGAPVAQIRIDGGFACVTNPPLIP